MILAIDLGSTRFKAALYDDTLNECSSGAASIPHEFDNDGCVKIQPAEARRTFADAVATCLAGAPGVALSAIAITSQAQTFTLLTRAGEPRLPFFSWQDTHSTDACHALEQVLHPSHFAEHTSFGSLLPALQLCQLRRLCDAGLGPQPGEKVLHLPSWFVRLLTGVNVIDDNLAAMSGLYSMLENHWWQAAVDASGVRSTHLTGVARAGTVVGRTTEGAAAFGLKPGIPVILAGNDQTAGGYAAALHEDMGALITLGTAQVIYTVSDTPVVPASGVIRGPYPGDLWYRMGADGFGGSLVNWAATIFANGAPAQFFELAAKSLPGCNGVRFDTDDALMTGSWQNLGLQHTAADLCRSILEALCDRMAAMVKRLDINPDTTPIRVAGGGAESALWLSILSERLGAPLSRTTASPLLGAARLARDACVG